jgi:hypothetical protein
MDKKAINYCCRQLLKNIEKLAKWKRIQQRERGSKTIKKQQRPSFCILVSSASVMSKVTKIALEISLCKESITRHSSHWGTQCIAALTVKILRCSLILTVFCCRFVLNCNLFLTRELSLVKVQLSQFTRLHKSAPVSMRKKQCNKIACFHVDNESKKGFEEG